MLSLRFGDYCRRFRIGRLVALASIAVFAGSLDTAWAQPAGQKTFTSAGAACAALVSAVEQNGESALLEILGPTAKEIISGGNEVEDRNSRRQFVEKYHEMHRLVREPDGTITIYVGADNWPLTIILRQEANRWYFDPAASKKEILFRRIGRNELQTIDVFHELVNGQNGTLAFATTTVGPFHGYYYRTLKRQRGFAFLAYPAEYRSSGVMTFIVNKDGNIYQKDLGPRTAIRARAITQYDPDATWKRVE